MTEIEELELRITKALDRLSQGVSAGAGTEQGLLDLPLELCEAPEEAVLRAKMDNLTEQVVAFEVERADFEKVKAELAAQIAEKEQAIAQLHADLSEQVKRRDEDLAALDAMIAELEEAEILQRGRMKSYAS